MGKGQDRSITRTEQSNRWLPGSPSVLAAVLLIAVVAFLIRWIDIHRSLWLDELHTSWTVGSSLSDVYTRAQQGNQSPLYFYVNWILVQLLGHSEWSLRFLSVISGTGLVLLGFTVAYRSSQSCFGALMAAILISIDPYFIEYSQEARPYALLQVFGLLQIYFFGRRFLNTQIFADDQPLEDAKDTDSQNGISSRVQSNPYSFLQSEIALRIGLILSIALCIYTHFTSVLLTGSLVLFPLVWNALRGHAWTLKRFSLVVDVSLGLLSSLPLAGSIFAISSRRQNWELFVDDYQINQSIVFQFWTYAIPGFCLLGLWLLTGNRRAGKPQFATASLYFFAYLFSILLAWIALKADWAALYHQRYFMIGWSGLIIALAIVLGLGSRRASNTYRLIYYSAGTFIVLISFSLNSLGSMTLWTGKMPFASTWKDAVEGLNQQSKGEGELYLFSNLIEDQSLAKNRAENSLTTAGRRSQEEAKSFNSQKYQQALTEYCLFPIRGIYKVEQNIQIPRPTLFRPRFRAKDVNRMLVNEKVYLLIRGDQTIVSDILNEFAQFGMDNGLWIENRASMFYEFRGASGQYVCWFEFVVREDDSDDSQR